MGIIYNKLFFTAKAVTDIASARALLMDDAIPAAADDAAMNITICQRLLAHGAKGADAPPLAYPPDLSVVHARERL